MNELCEAVKRLLLHLLDGDAARAREALSDVKRLITQIVERAIFWFGLIALIASAAYPPIWAAVAPIVEEVEKGLLLAEILIVTADILASIAELAVMDLVGSFELDRIIEVYARLAASIIELAILIAGLAAVLITAAVLKMAQRIFGNVIQNVLNAATDLTKKIDAAFPGNTQKKVGGHVRVTDKYGNVWECNTCTPYRSPNDNGGGGGNGNGNGDGNGDGNGNGGPPGRRRPLSPDEIAENLTFDEIQNHGDPSSWLYNGEKRGSGLPATSPATIQPFEN